MMKLYVLRHGKTSWNALRKVQGAADIPLAKEGIDLAEKVGENLKDVPFDLCFTSPLLRARQTAMLVLGRRAEQIPVISDKRIQEIDFGVLEGTQFKDEEGNVISREMEVFFKDPQNFPRPENGENISDILKRTREFWEEKINDPSLQDKTILIASHGCAVRALLQNIYQDPDDFWHGCVPPNCSISLVEVIDGKAVLLEEDKVYA
ncbi:histidine phosphatase family protein [Blautia glucerasea]